jgi:hypothetical protein
MAHKQKIIFKNGEEVVHFTGVGQGDYALCGHDLAGDSIFDDRGGYKCATPTDDKVTCVACIEIVEYCKTIKTTEYTSKKTFKK